METFTQAQLNQLIDASQGPAVSLFMPTHRTGRDVREDSIRLKNLLNAAEEQLIAQGVRAPEAREILQPGEALLRNEIFWQDQLDGLAIFAAPGRFDVFRVPMTLEEVVFVGRRFHVKPLLPLLQDNATFYVLACSQKEIRLFEGTRDSLTQLHPDELPHSLREALNTDVRVGAIQQRHSAGAGATGPNQGEFAGHGAAEMDLQKKDEIREAFRRVSDALDEFFSLQEAPLVFAGVEYLFPIFRDTCQYRSLVPEPVAGNPEGWSERELHQKAWGVVQSHLKADQHRALERFQSGKGEHLSTSELHEILPAAHEGRIETLFIAADRDFWGTLGGQEGEFHRCERTQPEAEELLEHAAVETLRHGGRVFALRREEMPAHQLVAAVLRYNPATSTYDGKPVQA